MGHLLGYCHLSINYDRVNADVSVDDAIRFRENVHDHDHDRVHCGYVHGRDHVLHDRVRDDVNNYDHRVVNKCLSHYP